MTWNTSTGERVLQGKELKLYTLAMKGAFDYLNLCTEADLPFPSLGLNSFDKSSPQEKMEKWLIIFNLLTNPEMFAEKITTEMEGVAYTPFTFLITSVDEEVEAEVNGTAKPNEKYYWRTLILDTYQEMHGDDENDIEDDGNYEEITVSSTELDRWYSTIDSIADAIFEDRDWQDLDWMAQKGLEVALNRVLATF